MLRHINEKKLCSLVCLLILITHVDRAYGGVIITLRFEFSTPAHMQLENHDYGVIEWEGFWEREIDFDTDDYDQNIGIAYADLQRVEDSYTSSTQPFLNFSDRAQDLTVNPQGVSHLYLGMIDFSTLDTTYKSLTQASIQYAPQPTNFGFIFDPQDPNDPPHQSSFWGSSISYWRPEADQPYQIQVSGIYDSAVLGDYYSKTRSTSVAALDAWSIKSAQAQAVPEPSTAIAMGLLGVVGFAGNRRRRCQVSAA